MSFELFQDVILTDAVPEYDLQPGDVGTVVEHHAIPWLEEGYSVEFLGMTGQTVEVLTLPARKLRAATPADRPSVGAFDPS